MDWSAAITQLEAGSPLAIGAVLVWVALNARKAVLATVARLGARVGRLEQDRAADREVARMEKARRWQLEAVLLADGVQLPPWPDLPDTVPAPLPRHSLPDWMPTP